MQFSYTPYAFLYGIAVVIALALVVTVARRRGAPGGVACLVNLLALAEWSGSTALYILGADVPTKIFWLNATYIGIAIIPPTLLVFVARYTSVDSWLSLRRLVLLYVVPLATIVVVWTNDYHHLQRTNSVLDASGPFLVLHSDLGPWLWVNLIYSYALALLALGLLVRAFRRVPHLLRQQMGAVFLGVLVPTVGAFLDVFRLSPWPQIDITPLLFTLTGAAFTIAIVRFRMLDIVPVARDTIIESLDDGVLVLDSRRRIIDINPAAQRLFGHTSASAIGEAVEHIWPTSSTLLDAASAEMAIGADRRLFAVRCSPVYARDRQPVGQLIVLHDITAQRQVEAERLTLERKLQNAQKLESIGILAGGIAHDFNNLLGIILGTTSLALADLPPAAPVREDLEVIRLTARRAAELTEQILLYAGRGLPNLQPVDLNEVIAELHTLLQASLTPRICLEMHLAPLLLPLVADATQLRQVATNLIINASEAIGDVDGTITLTTALRDVDASELGLYQLAPEFGGRYAVLEVADSGAGMSTEMMMNIFEPFFTTKFLGRGLGLAVVQGIIRGHNGALRVRSAVGHGTTFTALLPVAPRDQRESAQALISIEG